jgi:hypothetical protein
MATTENVPRLSTKYLEAAKTAVAYTRKVLDIGAANKTAPWDFHGKIAKGLCAGTAISKGILHERIDEEMGRIRRTRTHDEEVRIRRSGANEAAIDEEVDRLMARIPVDRYEDYVDVMAYWATHFGCGNCGPHSAVAFVHLRDRLKVSPLDWMMYDDFAHAFVIVGRRSDTDPRHFTTWNRDAAICDPWRGQGEAEPVFPYANLRFNGKRLNVLVRVD